MQTLIRRNFASHTKTPGVEMLENDGQMEIILLFLRLSNVQKLHLYMGKIPFVDRDFLSSV